MEQIEYLNSIDTQSEVYFRFKAVRSERASYFFNDEHGQAAYKVAKRLRKFKNPILEYDGMHICDQVSMRQITPEEWSKCVKVYNNGIARRKRLKERIREMHGYLYFVTLTFDDEELKLSAESRRHNIINPLLKKLKEEYGLSSYVGVKEYGNKTDREHYHFIMCFEHMLQGDVCISTKYGKNRPREFIKNSVIEQIYNSNVNVAPITSGNEDKVCNYAAKVAGYIDKETNKTQHLIYSSNFKPSNQKPQLATVDANGWLKVPDDDDFFNDLFGIL